MRPCNIFQLQRLSVNDGEGIRTTVFFKGCHLRCQWCANPESWRFEEELMFLPYKCVGCGECVDVCPVQVYELQDGKSEPVNSEECLGCESCVEVCENSAIEVKEM